jgi:50S ribosomal protein L16 3-hydroxylase
MLFVSDNIIKLKIMISPINLLGNMSEKEFTQKFWGQKPCHIESVVEDYRETITKNILKNLLHDDHLYTKFITHNNNKYITQFGPLKKKLLSNKNPYTLLIHKIQLCHKFSYDLFNSIKFIPFFRHDDVMLSFSNIDGTVGPHYDSYDVFLFQGSGEKNWSIGSPRGGEEANTKFKINKKFRGQFEFLAKPGDVIYIPPNTPHYGVAKTNDCITYSIGFRSPSNHDIKQRYLEFLLDGELDEFDIYNDSNDRNFNVMAKIPTKLIKYIDAKCKSSTKNNNNTIFIGQFMSEPDIDNTFTKKKYSHKKLVSNIKEQKLYFDVASRAVYFDNNFFINGVHIPVEKISYDFFKKFFDDKECKIIFCGKNHAVEEIIIDLLNDGFIHLNSPKFLF